MVDSLSRFAEGIWGRGEVDRLDEALFDPPRKLFTLPMKERFELPSIERGGDRVGSLRFLADFLFEWFILDGCSVASESLRAQVWAYAPTRGAITVWVNVKTVRRASVVGARSRVSQVSAQTTISLGLYPLV